jgi:lauroyl/myristoyl acyltransferase
MKFTKLIRYKFELVLFHLGKFSVQYLPRSEVLRLSRFLGHCAYFVSFSRRRYAEANLNLVYGDSLSEKDKRNINIKSFQNFALIMLDIFWFDHKTDERLDKYMQYDKSFDAIFDGTPNIILTAHFGNWEIVSVACGKKGHPLTSVSMPPKNAFAGEALKSLRVKSGSDMVHREGALKSIIKALRKGRSTAFLLDQDTLPEEGGTFVPFFGLPVPVSNVAGALQARTNAKLVVAWCMPDKVGCYTVYANPPMDVDKDNTTKEEITARITLDLEKVIRTYPDYWLWCYRRWRFFRAEDPAERYPYYAESYEEHAAYRKLIREHRAASEGEKTARRAVAEASAARRRKLKEREQKGAL